MKFLLFLTLVVTSVSMMWDRNTETCGVKYRVYRSVDNGPSTKVGDALVDNTFKDENLPADFSVIRYHVTAYCDNTAESANSNFVFIFEAMAPSVN